MQVFIIETAIKVQKYLAMHNLIVALWSAYLGKIMYHFHLEYLI